MLVSMSMMTVLAIAPRAAAQEGPLTLDDAVARALTESPRIAELRAREEGARAAVDTRAAASKPQVSLQDGIAELIKGYQVIKRNQFANI